MVHLGQVEQRILIAWQVSDRTRSRQIGGNVLGRLDFAQLHQTLAGIAERLGQQLGGIRITLGRNDGRLLLLLGLLDEETGLFGVLLGDLLHFDGQREFAAERQVGDGDVVEDQAELGGALGQVVGHLLRDHLCGECRKKSENFR